MLDIRELILQLTDEYYESFAQTLDENKAEKSQRLLQLIREDELSDKDIIDDLEVNSTAYYTLRSRLNDKLQEFLLEKVKGPKLDLLEKVNNLEHILFNYPQKQAINIIQKLESELKRYDHPIYLIRIYSALKKLSQNTSNYYTYSQLYNQHITFLIDFDKCEDLLAEMLHTIGQHFLSRQPEYLDRLHIIIEQMLEQSSHYQDSNRFYLIKSIVSIYYQLYLGEDEQEVDLEPAENILQRVQEMINEHKADNFYTNLKLLFDYFSFEYYHKYGIRKKEQEYFLVVNEDLLRFLSSYNYYAVPSLFLMSKLDRAVTEEERESLAKENQTLLESYEPSEDDAINFINFHYYLAISAYYVKDYEGSNHWLNKMRNSISFKQYPHAEIQIKFLLSINYFFLNELELSSSFLKSIGRKISNLVYHDYTNAKILRKIILAGMKSPSTGQKPKLLSMMHEFKGANIGNYAILKNLEVNEDFIDAICG